MLKVFNNGDEGIESLAGRAMGQGGKIVKTVASDIGGQLFGAGSETAQNDSGDEGMEVAGLQNMSMAAKKASVSGRNPIASQAQARQNGMIAHDQNESENNLKRVREKLFGSYRDSIINPVPRKHEESAAEKNEREENEKKKEKKIKQQEEVKRKEDLSVFRARTGAENKGFGAG